MAIQPGTYNFTMQRRADFSLQLVFKDGNNNAINLSLTDVQTATFETDTLAYDVLLENTSGLREYYLEGVITMSEGYTAP